MNALAKRWRALFAVVALSFVVCTQWILTNQSEANHAIGKIKIGMTVDEVESIAASSFPSWGGLFYRSDNSTFFYRYWQFDDNSKISVTFKDHRVFEKNVCASDWMLEFRLWLSAYIDI